MRLDHVSEFCAPGQATVIRHTVRIDALSAALVNGTSSKILDFDELHAHIVLHPTTPIAYALLALAETRPVSGVDFLHALVLGIEVDSRVLQPAGAILGFKVRWPI